MNRTSQNLGTFLVILVGALLGIFLWHESVDLLKILGIVLIFISVVMLSRKE